MGSSEAPHQRVWILESNAAEDEVLGEGDLRRVGQTLGCFELGVEQGHELVVALRVAGHVSEGGFPSRASRDRGGARARIVDGARGGRGDAAAGGLRELRPDGGALHGGGGKRGGHGDEG